MEFVNSILNSIILKDGMTRKSLRIDCYQKCILYNLIAYFKIWKYIQFYYIKILLTRQSEMIMGELRSIKVELL